MSSITAHFSPNIANSSSSGAPPASTIVLAEGASSSSSMEVETLVSEAQGIMNGANWPRSTAELPPSVSKSLADWQKKCIADYKALWFAVRTKKSQHLKLVNHKNAGSFPQDLNLKFKPIMNLPMSIAQAVQDQHRSREQHAFMLFKNSCLDLRIDLAKEDWKDSVNQLANLSSDKWLKEQLLHSSPSLAQFAPSISLYLVAIRSTTELFASDMKAKSSEQAARNAATAAIMMTEPSSAAAPADPSLAVLAAVAALTKQVARLTTKVDGGKNRNSKNGSGPGRDTTRAPSVQPRRDRGRSVSRPPSRSTSTSRPKRQQSFEEEEEDDEEMEVESHRRPSRQPHQPRDRSPAKSRRKSSSPPPADQRGQGRGQGRAKSPHGRNAKSAPNGKNSATSRR
jgi:hypothetical protein